MEKEIKSQTIRDKYAIKKLLGEGSFGKVYLAKTKDKSVNHKIYNDVGPRGDKIHRHETAERQRQEKHFQ